MHFFVKVLMEEGGPDVHLVQREPLESNSTEE